MRSPWGELPQHLYFLQQDMHQSLFSLWDQYLSFPLICEALGHSDLACLSHSVQHMCVFHKHLLRERTRKVSHSLSLSGSVDKLGFTKVFAFLKYRKPKLHFSFLTCSKSRLILPANFSLCQLTLRCVQYLSKNSPNLPSQRPECS